MLSSSKTALQRWKDIHPLLYGQTICDIINIQDRAVQPATENPGPISPFLRAYETIFSCGIIWKKPLFTEA
jgi:hypothetical protein